MRIVQIVHKPQRRGAEIFAFQLSEHLLNKGHQVKTVYLYSPPNSNVLNVREQDEILNGDESHFSEKFPGWNPVLMKKLVSAVVEFNPDVVQLNGGRTTKYGTLLRFLFPRRRWVLIYRNIGDPNIWLKRRWSRWFYRTFLIPGVDGMVAVNSSSLNTLTAFYGRRQRIIRIPRGVDPTIFKSKRDPMEIRNYLQTPAEARVLIFVGSLTQEKRVDKLVHLLRKASEKVPGLYLWIVGDGPLRADLESLSAQLGLDPHVRFTGSQEDVASFMNSANLLALTSETEGIPGVILEAALLAVPCVAFSVGGVSECVLDRQTGILIHQEDDFALASAVVELMVDDKKRTKMGEAARMWMLENFSLDRIVNDYLQFYRELLWKKTEDVQVRSSAARSIE